MNLKRKLKIAVLATVTDFGGAERVVLTFIKNINSDQFEVLPIIFTRVSMLETVFFTELKKTGKKYYSIIANRSKFKYLNPLINLIDAYKLIKKNKIELIHTHGYRADIMGILLSRFMRLPVISTCHGFISNNRSLKIYNKLDCYFLRYSERIIAVSDGIKKDLITTGISEQKITVIQNAVEQDNDRELFNQNRKAKHELLHINRADFVVGYVGRLSEEKGVKYLIEAHKLLKGAGANTKILIIGEGPQRAELESIVQKAGFEASVIFTGFQRDIESWLPAMDAFVLPSLTEGTPMSLLEAMALGIPVVASAVGGVPQVIQSGKNGLLVSPGRPEEIKNALQLLYENEPRRRTFSKEAQETIKSKYSTTSWIQKIEKIHVEPIAHFYSQRGVKC